MKKLIILPMLTIIMASSIAEQSTLEKFDALVMNTHQGSNEYFVNIPKIQNLKSSKFRNFQI